MARNDKTAPDEVFADGIGWIGIHGGVVRMEFFSFDAPPPEGRSGKEPERTVRQRVVMPVDGFLRSLAAMTDVVKKLEETGMVSRKRASAGQTPAHGAASDAAPTGGTRKNPPSSSPNFG